MSDPDVAIIASRLAAGYGSKAIWSDANFSIPSGSFTAILGPNGAGKSTLIRLILGLLHPIAGKLEVFGEAPRRGNPRIGYVPQGSTFDPELSIRGRDFVELGVDGHRWGVRLASRAQVAAPPMSRSPPSAPRVMRTANLVACRGGSSKGSFSHRRSWANPACC